MGRARRYSLDQKGKEHIEENYGRKTVMQLSKDLGVSTRTIYRYLGEKGLSSLDTVKEKKVKKQAVIASNGIFDHKAYGNWPF